MAVTMQRRMTAVDPETGRTQYVWYGEPVEVAEEDLSRYLANGYRPVDEAAESGGTPPEPAAQKPGGEK